MISIKPADNPVDVGRLTIESGMDSSNRTGGGVDEMNRLLRRLSRGVGLVDIDGQSTAIRRPEDIGSRYGDTPEGACGYRDDDDAVSAVIGLVEVT